MNIIPGLERTTRRPTRSPGKSWISGKLMKTTFVGTLTNILKKSGICYNMLGNMYQNNLIKWFFSFLFLFILVFTFSLCSGHKLSYLSRNVSGEAWDERITWGRWFLGEYFCSSERPAGAELCRGDAINILC